MSLGVVKTSSSVSSSWSRQQLRPAVWVNLSANNGRARKRWRHIESEITVRLPQGTQVYYYDPPFDMRSSVEAAVQSGINCLISAGGDGSVNLLLNALIDTCGDGLSDWAIGGIGLGSSNDFVKPGRTTVGGCPTRLNPEGVANADVVRAEFLNHEGEEERRYFVLNASMGVTAEANLLFNRGDWLLDLLKPRFVSGSILYAAIKAILMHRNFPVEMEIDGHQYDIQLSNLAILKSPNVAGTLLYDQHVSSNDGFLAVNYCDNMRKVELLRTLLDLSRGRFVVSRKRVCHRARLVRLKTPTPAVLEMDGEVFNTTRCSIKVLPSPIRLLGC